MVFFSIQGCALLITSKVGNGRMKIAVIGGGASGIISAYLLQDAHDVQVFEKQDTVGGHVRTLGRNVSAPGLPGDIHVENGVLGFHRATYPNLHKLFAHLGTPLLERRPSSALYREGQFFPKIVLMFTEACDHPRFNHGVFCCLKHTQRNHPIRVELSQTRRS